MKYIPFRQFGPFKFSYSVEEIRGKIIGIFKKISIGNKRELGKEYPTIYIQDIDALVVFQENGNSIRYIETTSELTFEDCNLQKNISDINNKISSIDKAVTIDQEGTLTSEKFGFRVTPNEEKKGNSILIFNHDYLNEDIPSPHDIVNYYLGNKDLPKEGDI